MIVRFECNFAVAQLNFMEALEPWDIRIQAEHNAREVDVSCNDSKTRVFVATGFVRVAVLVDFKLNVKFEEDQQQVGSVQGASTWHGTVPNHFLGRRHQVAETSLELGQNVVLFPHLELGLFWVKADEAAPTQPKCIASIFCRRREIVEVMGFWMLTTKATAVLDAEVGFASR
jgi:hypothetical protein